MGAIYEHGGHLDLRIVTICTNFQSHFSIRLHIKFEGLWPVSLMVSEKKIFFYNFLSHMGTNDPPGSGQFGPRGHGWQDLCRRPLNIATY